ncbi:hypothetical protein EYZ11_009412 [Aspergillus tanneri]|uniref:Uncharacterized protein n=1 Tax=Aspergillus tanneri TaxID=1220188 RepID=A0A4S3J8E1_9EURO|nr:hypothetical protein EYZ11_009412 [Aspergillus tanneri]
MMSDAEKDHGSSSLQSVAHGELEYQAPASRESRYQKWARSIRGLETRGIEPVPLHERLDPSAAGLLHMLLIWFSMGMSLNNIVVGSLGTLVMQLSFSDAILCAIFGNLLGGMAVGWMSTWGPRSGHRTLIVARYFMGYHPSKICCLLNILTNLGYGMMNSMVGGQLLAKLSGGTVSVIVGIVIVALASWAMATFGMRIFQLYESDFDATDLPGYPN